MTLAVALKFPWPEWTDAAPDDIKAVWRCFPEFRPEPALIFASDSRWSYSDHTEHDGAVKAAVIDKYGGATYAGNTDAGETAIHLLTEYFHSVRADEEPDDLRDVLKDNWRAFKRSDRDTLQLAFGFFLESGDPILFRADSSDDFLPRKVLGSTHLGSEAAIGYFRKRLKEHVAEHYEDHSDRATDQSPQYWATMVETTIWEACVKRVDETVGSPTSCIVIRRSGPAGSSTHVVDPVSIQPTRISLSADNIQEFYDHPLRQSRPVRVRWQHGHRPDSVQERQ